MKLTLDINIRTRKFRPDEKLVSLCSRAIKKALEYEGVEKDCEISLSFVSDRTIRKINREFRDIDKATDVLSFPQSEGGDLSDCFDGERYQLGDIVVSLERAALQGELYGHSTDREAAFLCVHSVLHLLGYDHERSPEDDEDMCRRQREIMTGLGI
jgi:probable rRNA maturation factor